ncbi:MAG: FecR domain-containing protein [Spirochaetota bacterium]
MTLNSHTRRAGGTMIRPVLIVVIMSMALFPLLAEVTVKSFKGTVGMIVGTKTQPLTVGMKLAEGTALVTGPNSELVLDINGNSLTLKPLTTLRINSATMAPGKSSASVALKGGSVVSDVKQIQGVRTDFSISTPVATSSVRGTAHTVTYGPEKGIEVSVSHGTVAVASPLGGTKPVPAGLGYVQSASAPAPLPVTAVLKEAAMPSMGKVFSGVAEASSPAVAAAETVEAAPEMAQILSIVDAVLNPVVTDGRLKIIVTIGH